MGRVKTRLGAEIGPVPATWWFRHQVRRLLRHVQDPRWETVLAVSPQRALHARAWPPDLPRLPQGRGSLGTRMTRVLRGHRGKVCLIGADIPGITPAHIAASFALLGSADAVFGPALDGGFWLLGFKQTTTLPAGLFEGVRWSTPHAMADTIATLPRYKVAFSASLRDVDTADDLQ